MQKIYIIGIGGIGVSGLARYYKEQGYKIFGSDSTDSELIHNLQKEGMDIIIGNNKSRINDHIEFVIHSESIPGSQEERQEAKRKNITDFSYPEALGKITRNLFLISIAGTHGKSTTTSLISLLFKNSDLAFSSIVGTLLKEFDGKNYYHRSSKKENRYFILESCEYKESFLNYFPNIGIITNIEADHLDYYKNLENYIHAFQKFIKNIRKGGYAIINMEDKNSVTLLDTRTDISFICVYNRFFILQGKEYIFPEISMQIPGDHILFDAHIAYIVGILMKIEQEKIIQTLSAYTGVWRRMEIIGETKNGNILMSDYGHHPTEILLTTKAIKEKRKSKKLFCIFQPHQYSRTLELLDDFKTCFSYCDTLIIPNIYESRDSEKDKLKINSAKLIEYIQHNNKKDGEGIENTLKLIEEYDKKNEENSIVLILGAGDIDNIRFKIEQKS